MAIELTVTATYPRDPDTVFGEASRFDEMIEASKGVATYQGLPDGQIEEGRTYTVYVIVWGILHNPRYKVHVDRVDRVARVIESREQGRSINQWDHTLSVAPHPDGSLWTDRIIIDSGNLTLVMTLIARTLYRARHKNRAAAKIRTKIRRV